MQTRPLPAQIQAAAKASWALDKAKLLRRAGPARIVGSEAERWGAAAAAQGLGRLANHLVVGVTVQLAWLADDIAGVHLHLILAAAFQNDATAADAFSRAPRPVEGSNWVRMLRVNYVDVACAVMASLQNPRQHCTSNVPS